MDTIFFQSCINAIIEFSANATVAAISGALVSTIFVRKGTEKEIINKIKETKFEETADLLLDKGYISYREYFGCKNFMTIAKKADEFCDNVKHSKEYDLDWFLKFYDYSTNISNSEMQILWAKILANEINNPNSTSLTLLNSMSMMRREDAQKFVLIARLTFPELNYKHFHPLIFFSKNRKWYDTYYSLSYSDLRKLERLGLIDCDYKDEKVFLDSPKKLRYGNHLLTVYGNPDNKNIIQTGNVTYTDDGRLLYTFIDYDMIQYDSKILEYVIERFRIRGCRVLLDGHDV